jgi:hypothetical protein
MIGISIFCLANQNSATFTNIFGGASGDEGLGLFSWCMDWQYISGGYSPLYFPMDSLISQGLGICGCIVVFTACYYGNVWNAQQFPFLSQEIFSETSNASNPVLWNQTLVIGPDNLVNQTAVEQQGLPWFATTYAINILVANMATTAALIHLCLWYPTDMLGAFPFTPTKIQNFFEFRDFSLDFWRKSGVPDENQDHYDPHYKLMQAYKAVPNWWFGLVLLLSFVIAMTIIYTGHTSLPWWGLIVAMVIGYTFLIIFGAMQAITGVQFLVQSIVQMIGGYIQPGNPVSNMYFSLYVSVPVSHMLT